MNVAAHDAQQHEHSQWFYFVRHFFEMTVAMLLGMAVYGLALGLILGFAGSSVEDARLGHPALFALGMAASMSIPMVGWMRRRGHDWRACGEMTAAMFVPAILLIGCYWLDAISADAVCPLACATMMPAMAVAMLYRRDSYTCRRVALGSPATTSS
jgi:flagellar biosynthetic protein FliP